MCKPVIIFLFVLAIVTFPIFMSCKYSFADGDATAINSSAAATGGSQIISNSNVGGYNNYNHQVMGNGNNISQEYINSITNDIIDNKKELNTYINKNQTYNLRFTITLSVSLLLNIYLINMYRRLNATIKQLQADLLTSGTNSSTAVDARAETAKLVIDSTRRG